ncbi:MAG: class I SAM-dependent methyltransferase [Anaerolineales bacterium]|nr:class I SAM-dependent methyltransferase [Anaerolineales bacterium]
MSSLVYEQRLRLQESLDASKTQDERNKLGQFATPPKLANEIIEASKEFLDLGLPIRFLDPAFGTGAFYAALRQAFKTSFVSNAQGVEIDPHYGNPTQNLWQSTKLNLVVADFTQLEAPREEQSKPNLIVCNPPYVRHHHITSTRKAELREKVKLITGIQLNGLSGFYCYYMLMSHAWMANGALGCWLIPGEFLDVNYGKQVKQYLLTKVKLLRIHRFDPLSPQFDDALVSSVVVWFRKETPKTGDEIEFTFGGALNEPDSYQKLGNKELTISEKWSEKFLLIDRQRKNSRGQQPFVIKVADLFHVKRGIATGANKFFILTPEQITEHQLPLDFFVPILPGPRFIECNEILCDERGNPSNTKKLFLLDCQLPEQNVYEKYPTLWKYLEMGRRDGVHERYLCRHRSPWYAQEVRPPAPILCTYMGRSQQPFRFVLNHSKATAPNVYLMLYPKPFLEKHILRNPEIVLMIHNMLEKLEPSDLIKEGRVYGGGLYKLEPKELGNASLELIDKSLSEIKLQIATQLPLL